MRRVQEDFKEALVQQFHASFGQDENSLTGWQALCEVIGISPIPEVLSEARKVGARLACVEKGERVRKTSDSRLDCQKHACKPHRRDRVERYGGEANSIPHHQGSSGVHLG